MSDAAPELVLFSPAGAMRSTVRLLLTRHATC
jgi:hypothetical protein